MKNTKSLLTSVRQLRKQKYPLAFIVVIVTLSLIMDNCTNISSNIPYISSDECQVLKIYDGDTMTLQCPDNPKKTKVRLYCIDTPEMKQKPWGTEARDHLRSITGEKVSLVKIDKDRYGRIVGEVYSNNVNLNLAQVKAGKAAVYTRYCKKSEYEVAEKTAKQAKLGIWSKSGLHQAPWKWRKRKR
ncbi:thermonuclease family protein [Candidatus Halobeggiatoa sp. HSG11]|nr:thermonuclease family protein [Candidatus Halobeggiatoa sp. HSG11]